MKTYIIGHQKPDTDAVVSPLALTHLFKQSGMRKYQDLTPVITHPLNPETQFIFDKYGVEPPQLIIGKDLESNDKVVLVDHNEESQRLEGLRSDHIVEVVDHHKVNLNLNQPIFLTFKPWGSTATIVYHLMKQNNVVPDKTLAALMLCAILSDTVGFKSATTTVKDKEYGNELAKIADIDDVEALTLEIFKAKSNVSNLSDKDMVVNDFKIFDFPQTTLINQIETVEQAQLLAERKDDLLNAMQDIKKEKGVNLLFVAITDVLRVNTKLLLTSEEEAQVAQEAFGGTVEDHVLDIGPKMSRKKEIAPAIEKALTK